MWWQFQGCKWLCWSYGRHYSSTHVEEKCGKISYLTWVTLYGESFVTLMVYLMIWMVQYDMCVFYFEFCGKCSLCNDHFQYVLAVSGVLYDICWNLCAILGCVAEGLSVLVLLLIPPLYCCHVHLVWICFHLNLVVVSADYYSSTLYSIFWGNPFLTFEGTCHTWTV